MREKPNIVLIMTDQQYAGAMSCAGNTDLHTPAMDRLAQNGVLFENAYCTYPLCIPSRESILTGRMPFQIGYKEWGDSIGEEYADQQMGVLFSKAGYECVYGGKLHAPGSDCTKNGFAKICGHDDHALAEACINYLKQEHDRPFLLVASFDNPHNICQWARNENLPWGNIPSAYPEDCPDLPLNYAIPPYEPEVIRMIQKNAPKYYVPLEKGPDYWRQYRNAYYRLIEKVDKEIMKILDALEDLGILEETLIVFTSDHGDGHGAHRWNQKSILYEECIKVPLILSFKGRFEGNMKKRCLVSNGLDLLPTFCDFAGIEAPSNLPGKSLRELLEGNPIASVRDQLVVETWPYQGDPGKTLGRALHTEKYKYIVYSWGGFREQLFDMEKDPGEMVNLAVNSRYKGILEEYRTRLARWCEETQDKFLSHIPGCRL